MATCFVCNKEATRHYDGRDWCDDCLLEDLWIYKYVPPIYKCWNCNKQCDPFNHYVSDDFHFCSKECAFENYMEED